ncbi:MAG: protein phosphatase 2C domain-containing protein [Selenomonadaceae bacterium]|nr:protein phosphatase 2C domain-containing protein [Selenomonadaceae bacterium]
MADIAIPAALFLCLIILFVLRRREKYRQGVPLLRSNCKLGAASSFGTRAVQQDYFGVKELEGALLILLADGIGQHGDIAAKLTVDTFRNLFVNKAIIDKPQYFFRRAANAANKIILNTLEERQGETSVAAVVIAESQFFYMLVGNCRVAVFRNGDLIPVSEGQTIDVLARHRYEEGRISKQQTLELLDKQRRYNVIGQDSFEEIELFSKPLSLRPGDLVVVMSEGVLNTLRWKEIEEILDQSESPQILAETVINHVDKSPMVDKANATILICRQS